MSTKLARRGSTGDRYPPSLVASQLFMPVRQFQSPNRATPLVPSRAPDRFFAVPVVTARAPYAFAAVLPGVAWSITALAGLSPTEAMARTLYQHKDGTATK